MKPSEKHFRAAIVTMEKDDALVQRSDEVQVGDRLRARHSKAQETEVDIACNILNEMTRRGTPASYSIGA